ETFARLGDLGEHLGGAAQVLLRVQRNLLNALGELLETAKARVELFSGRDQLRFLGRLVHGHASPSPASTPGPGGCPCPTEVLFRTGLGLAASLSNAFLSVRKAPVVRKKLENQLGSR